MKRHTTPIKGADGFVLATVDGREILFPFHIDNSQGKLRHAPVYDLLDCDDGDGWLSWDEGVDE